MSGLAEFVLVVDTSGSGAGLILAGAHGADVAVLSTRAGGYARTEDLAVEAARLFAARGRKAAELSAVGAVVGPGSYTGLRSGLAFLRGLAFVDGLPAVAVGSLELLAWRGATEGEDVVVASPAGSGRWVLAVWRRERESACELEAARIVEASEVEDFCRHAGRACSAVVAPAEAGASQPGAAGEERSRLENAARGAGLEPRLVPSSPDDRLAALVLAKLRRGETMRVDALVPVYVGPASARPNRDRVAVLGASE
ncbi:MAG: tRNA (adenosine(37)-N6)-threonylcarbamoyltransferase complex dimerization subunit type 1 TsaB [Candidatus Binatia bacterium]